MTSRLLIIPAAGAGSRLKTDLPKALVQVAGRTMLDRLASLYRPWVSHAVIVAHPSFARRLERAHVFVSAEVVEQQRPTGMLDAILLAATAAERVRPDVIWITWCDQVGVLPATLARFADVMQRESAALVMPTVMAPNPYVHLARNAEGRITRVLHRREGDAMPESGESDMGLFGLRYETFITDLPEYARAVPSGKATGERNFLPFIPWLAARTPVVTFPCTDAMEAVGVNTPDDLRTVEAWLARRAAR